MSFDVATIYTGFWINWSYGRIYGSTITLTAGNSAFLVAFVALWVRFVGGQLWTVLTFLVSIARSTTDPQDALYHQQQAILRNTSQPSNVMWAMLKLSWFWKGTARRANSRTFAFVFACLAYIAAFAIAGIFSSRLSSADSEVLLLPGSRCGMLSVESLQDWRQSTNETHESYQDWSIKGSMQDSNYIQLIHQSHVYVSQCYNSTLNDPNQPCLPYGRSRITWNTTRNVACPYDEEMCIANAINFDTGFLRSDTHFGINTKKNHVEYRKVMTCAPITTKGYVAGYFNASEMNETAGLGDTAYTDETFLTYSYGQGVFFTDNTTYAFSNYSFDYSVGYWLPFRIYDLDVEFAFASTTGEEDSNGGSSFTPIDSLTRSDSDLSLIFLAKNVSYLSEIKDPWFQATQNTQSNETGVDADGVAYSETVNYYTADEANTVVACAEQHQLRNPLNGAVTPLGGQEFLSQTQAQKLGFNDQQMAIFNRSFQYAPYNTISSVVPSLGGSYLLAAANQDNLKSTGLPNNQWELEFEHYFGVGLITVQLRSQQYVIGTLIPTINQDIIPAPEGFPREMCSQQIVRRTDHRSFSVLGLGIIFVLGLLFIIANYTVAQFVEKVQKHTVKGRYRNAEWRSNEFLQLQRMTYQHNNIGTWTGQHQMVPRTNPGDLFTLPESTQWNHNVPETTNKEGKGLFRTLSRAVSWGPQYPPPTFTGIKRPDSDEKSQISTADPEKGGVQIQEKQVNE